MAISILFVMVRKTSLTTLNKVVFLLFIVTLEKVWTINELYINFKSNYETEFEVRLGLFGKSWQMTLLSCEAIMEQTICQRRAQAGNSITQALCMPI